jgi:hypothetical protein
MRCHGDGQTLRERGNDVPQHIEQLTGQLQPGSVRACQRRMSAVEVAAELTGLASVR